MQKSLLFCLLLALLPLGNIAQTPFVCDGSFYLSLANGRNSQFYRVVRDPVSGQVSFSALPQGAGAAINSIGYRVTDNLIYGVDPDTDDLYQIDASGQATFLANITAIPSGSRTFVGEVTPDGQFLVLLVKNGFGPDYAMVKVDLSDPMYPSTFTLLRAINTNNPPNISTADITIDPYTAIVYGFDAQARRLITLDFNTGIVDNLSFPTNQASAGMGAMFYDAFGNLYGYGQPNSGTTQNTLFAINKSTGVLTPIATGPPASGNDGCSCPYTIQLQKYATPEVVKPCETFTYTFRIANATGDRLGGISLHDTLPDGMSFSNILRNPFGGSFQQQGSQIIQFNNLDVPLGIDSIIIEVVADTLSRGTYLNQATIQGLPLALGIQVVSDYPFNNLQFDPTPVEVDSVIIDPPNERIGICEGDSILISAADHPAVYYRWDDGFRQASRYVKEAGIYAVRAHGCEIVLDTFEIFFHPTPDITLTPDTFVCEGNSVPIQASGTAISYAWSPVSGLSNSTISNPVATPTQSTTYTVIGTNIFGCKDTADIFIEVKPLPMVDAGPDLEVCPNESITILANMPASVFPLWQPTQGLDDSLTIRPTFTPFAAGTFTYIVTGTDVFGCVNQDQMKVEVFDFRGNFIATDISCFGFDNGKIFTQITGLSPFSFELLDHNGNSISRQNSSLDTLTFGGLAPGSYQVAISDANGCRDTSQLISLAQPTAALSSMTTALGNVDCFGSINGSLNVQASGGTPPYQYSLFGTSYGPSGNFTGLGARAYDIRIRDANGCMLIHSDTIRTPTGLFGIVLREKWAACFGDTTGALTLGAVGGTAPYGYSYDGVNFGNNTTLTGLPAGTYTATIRDVNGCLASVPFAIGEPPLLQSSIAMQRDVDCFGAPHGAVWLQVTGGSPLPRYQFYLNGAYVNDLPFLDSLPAGTYSLVVEDDSLCHDSLSFTINEPPPLVANLDFLEDVRCFGEANGAFQMTATGGVLPYSYQLDTLNWQNSGNYMGLLAGNYNLLIEDDSLCQLSIPIEINQPDTLILVPEIIQGLACFGDTDAFIQFAPTGGTRPYGYILASRPTTTDSLFDNLLAGVYPFVLQDANQCEDTLTVRIQEPPELAASIALLRDVDCHGNDNGYVQISTSGGTPAFTYQLGASTQQDSIFTGLAPASYLIIVTDDSSCSDSLEIIIEEPDTLTVEIDKVDLRCFQDASGWANAQVAGGVAPYEFLWNSVPRQQTQTAIGLQAGTYIVTVTDSNACIARDTTTLTEPPLLELDLVPGSIAEAYCDWPNGQAAVEAMGGVVPYAFSWSGLPLTESQSDSLPHGNYLVLVIDDQGCIDSLRVEIPHVPPPQPSFESFPAYQDSILLSEAQIQFTNTSAYDVAWQWTFGDGIGGSSLENPFYMYDKPGVYPVTLVAYNSYFVCPVDTTVLLHIVPDGQAFFPNAFSPNNDGRNDIFYLGVEGAVRMEWQIFNRWGRLIQRINDPSQGWDGRDQSGRDVAEGVYVYSVNLVFNDGSLLDRTGTITVIR